MMHKAGLAQLVERCSRKAEVAGSIPTTSIISKMKKVY